MSELSYHKHFEYVREHAKFEAEASDAVWYASLVVAWFDYYSEEVKA